MSCVKDGRDVALGLGAFALLEFGSAVAHLLSSQCQTTQHGGQRKREVQIAPATGSKVDR